MHVCTHLASSPDRFFANIARRYISENQPGDEASTHLNKGMWKSRKLKWNGNGNENGNIRMTIVELSEEEHSM